MCAVSMIADDWRNRHQPSIDKLWPQIQKPLIYKDPKVSLEIAELRKEIEEMKKLLKAAKIYDAATGQPDCEMEEKIKFLRKVADAVGVSMEDIFPKAPQ